MQDYSIDEEAALQAALTLSLSENWESDIISCSPNAAMWRIFSLNVFIVSLYFLSLYLSSGLYFWATLQLDPEVAQ